MAIVIRAEEQGNTTQPLKVGISLPLKLKENLLLTSAPNLRSSDVGGWTLMISHFSLAQLDIQVQKQFENCFPWSVLNISPLFFCSFSYPTLPFHDKKTTICPISNLFLYASVMLILRTRLVITVQNSFQQQLNHKLQVRRTERQKKRKKKPSVLVQSFSAGSLRASVFASRSSMCIISFLTDTSIWKTQTSDQNRDTLFILGGKFL